jgi:hypothetical protein
MKKFYFENTKVVTQYYERGGLKIIDIENFIDTMKISWMKKKLLKDSAKRQSIIGADIDINQVLTLGPLYALQNFVKSKNQFWLDVFQSWIKLVKRYGEDDKIIQDQMASCVLWHNGIFKINSKTMCLKAWSEKDINFLNPLLDKDGKLWNTTTLHL